MSLVKPTLHIQSILRKWYGILKPNQKIYEIWCYFPFQINIASIGRKGPLSAPLQPWIGVQILYDINTKVNTSCTRCQRMEHRKNIWLRDINYQIENKTMYSQTTTVWFSAILFFWYFSIFELKQITLWL